MAWREDIGARVASRPFGVVMSMSLINRKSLFQYGFIALPVAFAGFPLYVLAPDFYATHHGLSLTLLGTLLLIIRFLDALQDPLIGWLTDRLQRRFLPILALAGAILCFSVFGLFNYVFLTPIFWFTLCMIFAVSSYSVLTIVIGAQATMWTTDKQDQTRIAGARESFGLMGLLIAVSMPKILSELTNPKHVYLWYGAIVTLLMLVGLINFSRLLSDLPTRAIVSRSSNVSLLSALRTLSKESLKFFLIYGLSMLASSIPAVLVVFYIRDLLGAEHLMALFLLLYFLSGVVAMPFWKMLSARFCKYKVWAFSNIFAVAGFIGAFFLNSGDVLAYGIVCIISGLALGADLTLPPSILADHVHARGNIAFSGTYYALLAFIAKASLAIASAISLPALDARGFKPQSLNSDSSLMALSFAYALIPSIIKFIAATLLYTFFIRSQSGGNNENTQDYGNRSRSLYA